MDKADRRRETGRRLAALGALSSAGLALTGAQAEAGIHVTTVNADIGFGAGDTTPVTLDMLPTVGNQLLIATQTYTNANGKSRSLVISGAGVGGFQLGVFQNLNLPFGSRFAKGATFNQAPSRASGGYITVVNASSGPAMGKFTDKYYLFSFQDASSKTLYGWIEGNLTDNSYDAMTYHLTAYAYDDTGAVIHAGDTGQSAVPEPAAATLGLLGAALVGGAAGVRRWKKARADAGATTA